MVNRMRHTPKGYIRVGTPRVARCFRMSRSVPYQLKPFVAYPIRGRCTVAEKEGTECTLFRRRYTYRKQSRKRLQATQQEQKKYFWATCLLWRSHSTSEKTVERWKLVIIFTCSHTCMDSLFYCTDTYHSFSWLLNKSSSGPFPKLTA